VGYLGVAAARGVTLLPQSASNDRAVGDYPLGGRGEIAARYQVDPKSIANQVDLRAAALTRDCIS